jgi:hypothetical protein
LNLVQGFVHSPLLNGSTHEGIFLDEYENQPIIVKKIPFKNKNDMARSLNEIEFSKQLSDLNLSPQFYGIARFGDGSIGIVSKRINRSWLLKNYKYFRDPKIKNELQDELIRALKNSTPETRKTWRDRITFILDLLTDLNIRAEDFQVLLCPDGNVFVIDLRHFTKTSSLMRLITANFNSSTKLEFTSLIPK